MPGRLGNLSPGVPGLPPGDTAHRNRNLPGGLQNIRETFLRSLPILVWYDIPEKNTVKLSAKIFLESKDKFIFGPGRLELLRTVKELGSLRKAAQKLGMSYRWAWGRLNNAEKDLGFPLLVRTDEPIGGRPMVLTEEAIQLIAWWSGVEKSMEKTLRQAAKNMPPFIVENSTGERSPEPSETKRLKLD